MAKADLLERDVRCRLLYLVGQLGPGGLERQLCYLLRAMDRKCYQPAVTVWNFSEDDVYVPQIRELGVPLYSLPPTLSRAVKLRAFHRLVGRLQPEVVHSYNLYTNFAAYWAVWGTQAIAFGSMRSDFTLEKEDAGPWLGRLSSRWPRSQISNNSLAAQTIRRSRSLFLPGTVSVVRNGVDLELFQCFPAAIDGQVRILGVGSLLPVKRWDRVIGAALELKQRGVDFLITIAGDGPLRRSLERKAQDIGVKDCVEFIGYSNNIPRLLADATFLVHTSDSEGCPNAIIEAMASGRPVVATDVGDVPSLVEDGKTGFVVCRKDEAMLVERMVTLINNRNLCRRMGEAGRSKAEREFGLDHLVSETLAAYKAAGWRG